MTLPSMANSYRPAPKSWIAPWMSLLGIFVPSQLRSIRSFLTTVFPDPFVLFDPGLPVRPEPLRGSRSSRSGRPCPYSVSQLLPMSFEKGHQSRRRIAKEKHLLAFLLDLNSESVEFSQKGGQGSIDSLPSLTAATATTLRSIGGCGSCSAIGENAAI